MNRELLEEYKLCVKRLRSLDKNIWYSAAILGIGSIAIIISIFDRIINVKSIFETILIVIVSSLAIGINLVWWRLAKRWWSIQQALLRRMEHIERQTNFRANLYIAYLDQINSSLINRIEFRTDEDERETDVNRPFLRREFIDDLNTLGNYDYHGIQPMLRYLITINILSWFLLLFLLFIIIQSDKAKIEREWLFPVTITYGWLVLWKFWEEWNSP